MLDLNTNSQINTIQVQAKTNLLNDILEESGHYLKGSQLMELNKTLNKHFQNYEIFTLENIELHENYEEENQTLLEIYLSNKKLEGLSQTTLSYYRLTLEQFINYIDKHLSDITTQDVREYFSYYQSLNNCSNTTLDNVRRNLNTFFNTLSNEGYIQYSSRDKRSPYKVVKDGIRYGSYYTEKQAKQAVKKLKQCNWDKSKVSEIQKSVGWKPLPKRGNIYPYNKGKGWCIRHKNKDRKMINYGSYKDHDLAVIVRDMLILNDWNKEEYPMIRELAETVLFIQRLIYGNMFGGDYNYTYLEGLCLFDRSFSVLSDADSKYVYYNKAAGRYSVQKYIDGSVINFGYYDSKEEALHVRELLIDNNWDKDVLDLVKEVGL